MAVKFDINKWLETKGNSGFLKIMLTIITFVIITGSVYLATNGKYNKLPGGIEMNIPVYKYDSLRISRDTIVINNNQKEFNIDNKGTININSDK